MFLLPTEGILLKRMNSQQEAENVDQNAIQSHLIPLSQSQGVLHILIYISCLWLAVSPHWSRTPSVGRRTFPVDLGQRSWTGVLIGIVSDVLFKFLTFCYPFISLKWCEQAYLSDFDFKRFCITNVYHCEWTLMQDVCPVFIVQCLLEYAFHSKVSKFNG